MKRILQISNYLYPHIGGIEQVARDIAAALGERDDFEQKIVCFNENASGGGYNCKREETVHDFVDGVEVIRCGCILKASSQSISLSFGKKIKAVMDSFKPDIVILHFPNPFQAFFLKRCLKQDTKFVLYWHSDIIKQKFLRKLFHVQTMDLLKRADKIVATSPSYVEGSAYLSRFREKCVVIPNCINTSRMAVSDDISDRAEKIREENAGKIICFALGRHIPYKGFSHLVEASKYLDERFAIYIGGKGELTESLKREAGDDKKISFLGRVSDEDLIAYYMAMDIFCFPSVTKNEAFGIALAEGMYFGKPAITFTIPGSGVNYVNLNDISGIECPNADSRAYAEAMTRLADDIALRERLGKGAKDRVERNFTQEQFNKNIKTLLSEL